jgi:hypothetical protein
LADRLKAGEHGRVVGVRPQERAEALDPVLGGAVGEMCPEDVVEDRVVRLADRVDVPQQQRFLATQAVRDVDVAGAIGVQPEREEGEPDVVRCERGHARPLEVRRQERVQPGVA